MAAAGREQEEEEGSKGGSYLTDPLKKHQNYPNNPKMTQNWQKNTKLEAQNPHFAAISLRFQALFPFPAALCLRAAPPPPQEFRYFQSKMTPNPQIILLYRPK